MVARVGVGDAAPEFELLDQDGKPVRLSDHAGRTAVLCFHPAAETPDGVTQARGIRDCRASYAAAGATVIGISPDEPATLHRFADEDDLDFVLLSDPDHAVAEAYGVWVQRMMYGHAIGHGIRRSTFIVGGDGTILWTYKDIPPRKHDRLVLKALRKLGDARGAGPPAGSGRPQRTAAPLGLTTSQRPPNSSTFWQRIVPGASST